MRNIEPLQIKLVIFDCDGVMFDTAKANTAYYNQILNYFRKPEMTPEQFSFVHMHTVKDSLAYLFKDDLGELGRAEEYTRKMSYFSFIKYMDIEPGLKPLLSKLRPDYRTAIVTNRTDTMDRILEEYGLEGDFDLVISARDVDRPKPYPDPLLKVLNYFSFEPHEAIYIGDSKLDEQAAEKAEIPLVAYNNFKLSSGYHITRLYEVAGILNI